MFGTLLISVVIQNVAKKKKKKKRKGLGSRLRPFISKRKIKALEI